MLVLTRRLRERVVLILPDGRHVVVDVAHIGPDKVRLAFEAPEEVAIWRSELLDKDGNPPPEVRR